MTSLLKTFSLLAAFGMIVPVVASANSLPNRSRVLQSQMKKCQAKAKEYVKLGYPEKANKQIAQCQKIKGQLSKLEKQKEALERKLASLNGKSSHQKHFKKQHQEVAPAPAPVEVAEPAPMPVEEATSR